ncbi:uncharacterized protein K452DRAFT_244254 [Aplosporella prunicola CBS 121167]|uniref:GPI inositol-deacylase n=1 Tax=Aplosporella prunicola CBS 121167 TaxID=1176127 RepID=A0A6A6BQZ8_9PEZI|nr:uncharacterized protein K452DRAFT_244254 [Aplosporella prunicola CBS 121167]KAF2145863.1 hypothetical protein K452DRAFT_244254 [Aplosporella prunicola CBS 121167]
MFKRFRRAKSDRGSEQESLQTESASSQRHGSTDSSFSVLNQKLFARLQVGRSKSEGFSSDNASLPSREALNAATDLGLHIIHQPGPSAPLDIIFVHGLGGHSRKTWCEGHDENLFWPRLWLPLEPDVGKARIFTFGYNSSFRTNAGKSISNIADFAKELLFEMRFAKSTSGEDLHIGRVPIIFVVHSMGGLVVKKACLLGNKDEQYRHIVSSVSAIVFLATPHRGSNLAETLNRVLAASFQSRKNFIDDLKKSSRAVGEVNEEFRHFSPHMSLWSFYETLATNIGPKKLMIVDKDSSVLGYPEEVSRPLNADHHEVCKYSGPNDANYLSVRNALKTLATRFIFKGAEVMNNQANEEEQFSRKLFRIRNSPQDDFDAFHRLWMQGTCSWFLSEPQVSSWLEPTPGSRILWYNAPPASGKSVLASHVINHLLQTGAACQYHFFRFDNQEKRSLSAFVRSMAYQLARDTPELRRLLVDLTTEDLRLESAEPSLLWQRVFQNLLFHMETPQPFYWVIDAMDECESPKRLGDLLQTISTSHVGIKVLVLSRESHQLRVAFQRFPHDMDVNLMELSDQSRHSRDIQMLVDSEVKHMRGEHEFKERVVKRIMERAHGNFLWARLILEDIVDCHTHESIQEALDQIPTDMDRLYHRMEVAIMRSPRQSDVRLAKVLLQWTICSRRSLSLTELSQALTEDFPGILDLKLTIQDICGQFVRVEPNGKVVMLHQTARDYLIQPRNSELVINLEHSHQQLLTKTLLILLSPELRSRIPHTAQTLQDREPFTVYAATSWSFHLQHSESESDTILDILGSFFKSTSVLVWIHVLALTGQLEILVKSSKTLSNFVAKIRKSNKVRNPMLHRLSDLDLLDQWAVDLVKVVGKFSKHLLTDPSTIYKLVPPFCPENSVLHRQFYQPELSGISLSGTFGTYWSDNLAKIYLPDGVQAWNIASAGRHIAILGPIGVIFIWNSQNFTEIAILRHSEHVTAMCFNSNGTKLATFGLRFTKLWSIPSGELLGTTPNPTGSRAMTMIFAEYDSVLVAGSNDKIIRRLQLSDIETGWSIIEASLDKDGAKIEGALMNTPVCMALNANASQVGVSYRGFPLSVYNLNDTRTVQRCRRATSFQGKSSQASASWFAVDRFTWNPVTGHIIGVYKDGCVFKWHPLTDENLEVQSAADEISVSSNGKLFITSSSDGTVKVWNFAYFSVIYQIFSDDLVTGLTFSPDCRRFYDMRGNCVNAWESNSLIRFADDEDVVSETSSEAQTSTCVSKASEMWLSQFDAISALTVAPDSDFFCSGNEDGSVRLHSIRNSEYVEILKFHNFLSVCHVEWGPNSQYIATADLSGQINIMNIQIPMGSIDPISKITTLALPSPGVQLSEQSIHQILFSHDSTLLLISTGGTSQICTVEDGKVASSRALQDSSSRKWINHPINDQLFLGVGPVDIQVFRWRDFDVLPTLIFHESHKSSSFDQRSSHDDDRESPKHLGGSHDASSIMKVAITQEGMHMLVHLRDGSVHGKITTCLLLIPITNLTIPEYRDSSATITIIRIPNAVSERVKVPLGVLPGSRLIFLDHDLWVCTFKLAMPHDKEAVYFRRHYFIPPDWMSNISTGMCAITKDGTFLCPRDDVVVIVRSSLDVDGF